MVPLSRPFFVAGSLLSATMALAAVPVLAHGLESSLERVPHLHQTFALTSQFSTGVPAAGAAVTLVAPSGQTVALGQTDVHGQLRFRLPQAGDTAWEVRVDQGPGHRDYLELPDATADRAAALPSPRLLRWPPLQTLLWGGAVLVLVGLLVRRPEPPHC